MRWGGSFVPVRGSFLRLYGWDEVTFVGLCMPVAGLSAPAVLLDLTMMDVTVTSPILMALLAHIGSLFPPSRVSIDLD